VGGSIVDESLVGFTKGLQWLALLRICVGKCTSIVDESLVGFTEGLCWLEMLMDFVYRLTIDEFLVDYYW